MPFTAVDSITRTESAQELIDKALQVQEMLKRLLVETSALILKTKQLMQDLNVQRAAWPERSARPLSPVGRG
jgi:hypothetical protein